MTSAWLYLGLLALGAAAEEPDADPCPRLRAEHRVSYRDQAPQIVQEVVRRLEAGDGRLPSTEETARLFLACWDTYTGGDGTDPSVARVTVVAGDDGHSLNIGCGAPAVRTLKIPDDTERLVQRVHRGIVRACDEAKDDSLANVVAFVWIESLLRATGERYNFFHYADEIAENLAFSRGRSFAVGFDVEIRDASAVVTSVLDDALTTAGLASGDELTSFDGVDLSELRVPDWQRYWFSPEPFNFSATFRNADGFTTLSGAAIPSRHRSLAWAVRGELGYVKLSAFSRGSLAELRRARRALESAGVQRLAIDLRGNSGGSVLPGLIDLFFKPGQTVLSYREHGDKEPTHVDASVEYWGIPVAILVDRDTASMSESLAAAFVTHRRGPVIGESTVGKGVGQSGIRILEEGMLNLVTRTYYFPGTETTWNLDGVKPTSPISIDDDERKAMAEYLTSPVIRLEQQWLVDSILRSADELLKGSP